MGTANRRPSPRGRSFFPLARRLTSFFPSPFTKPSNLINTLLAGSDKIVAEKQKQLDEWAKNQ
ncbi:DUF3502 domain-containing protein [Paenibacillus artemisiicola]|uniref:DUF3502 domain-containing protein n=1 Tax=Paenibacillus artemisiicola TaxID=1172618 RepID=UPI003B8321A3